MAFPPKQVLKSLQSEWQVVGYFAGEVSGCFRGCKGGSDLVSMEAADLIQADLATAQSRLGAGRTRAAASPLGDHTS